MDALILLIPLSLLLGGAALAGFLWTMKSGQYEDLERAAHRILFDDDAPATAREPQPERERTER
jgi:cbb3-type cytochrome oxidase maturation protein